MDGRALGEVVVDLGGGRRRAGDSIHPGVGLAEIAALGDYLDAGEAVCMIHANSVEEADAAEAAVTEAFTLGEFSPDVAPLVLGRLG